MSLSIVQVVNRIRSEVPQERDESIDTWLKKTWVAAVAEVEATKRPLPLVAAHQARSEAKLRHLMSETGKLLSESDEIEE